MDKETIQEINKVVKSTLADDTKRGAINSILRERRQKPFSGAVRSKAQWIEVDTNMYTCSECCRCFVIVPEDNDISEFNYCPNCGLKMEDEE